MIVARSTRTPSAVTVALDEDGRTLSFGEVVDGLAADSDVRRVLVGCLRDAPFRAFCWETPPVTRATLGRAFECELVDSPALARVTADPEPFAEHFSDEAAVVFPSLGRDAVLVAPCPVEPVACCAHLAWFVRCAPETSVHALWALVASTLRGHLGERPTWLSTAGLGVSWLHVRLDSRPKYYRTARYREVG